MPKEIKPPQSLTDILPKLAEDMEKRAVERQRNLRANEVFLQAESLLRSKQAKAEWQRISLFSRPEKFRSLPPVPFEYEDQEVRVQLKDHINTDESGHEWKDGISIVVSIGDVGRENLELFHLKKDAEHYKPVLRMGNRYSIKTHHDREATLEEIETAAGILTFIQETLEPIPNPQSQPTRRRIGLKNFFKK